MENFIFCAVHCFFDKKKYFHTQTTYGSSYRDFPRLYFFQAKVRLFTAYKVSVFGVFLVRTFRILTEYGVFSTNMEKYGPEKLQIGTIYL